MRAFKFIAQGTQVPDVGTYSNCAAVVIAESADSARAAIHAWGARQSPPDDTKWIDYAEVRTVDAAPGEVLLFVML